ncbi:MAG: hypothetical protein IKQ91_08735 [Oscillospiraceae bacterium]|nr:hypothetical protein [Oscillospiraceae bacterium]
MIRICHEARRRLRENKRSAAVIGAARIIMWLCGCIAAALLRRLLLQNGFLPADTLSAAPNTGDLFLLLALLTALLALAPLRVQTAWQLGRLAGTLDDNDLGFLAQSSNLWLWCKGAALRLLMQLLTVLSVLPLLVLYIAAKSIWLLIPPTEEGLLPLLTVLHLAILAAISALLPLRFYAAGTALPYCYLKIPHKSGIRIIRLCFRLTRGQTADILATRLLLFPALLLPFTAVRMLPALLVSEQLRCDRIRRHRNPRPCGRFSHLELHAYDA